MRTRRMAKPHVSLFQNDPNNIRQVHMHAYKTGVCISHGMENVTITTPKIVIMFINKQQTLMAHKASLKGILLILKCQQKMVPKWVLTITRFIHQESIFHYFSSLKTQNLIRDVTTDADWIKRHARMYIVLVSATPKMEEKIGFE